MYLQHSGTLKGNGIPGADALVCGCFSLQKDTVQQDLHGHSYPLEVISTARAALPGLPFLSTSFVGNVMFINLGRDHQQSIQ